MDTQLLINGQDMPATGGATFERRDPLTEKVVTRGAAATVADAIRAVESAARALPSWGTTGPNQRRSLLLRAADLLEARTPEFAKVMDGETGATVIWAGFNVHLAAGIIREAAALTTQLTGETIPSDKPGTLSMTVRQPAGVVLSIAPWNAPVILATRAIAYPLACGNTVVLKAAEMCPATHLLLAKVFQEAGLPPGVLNVVTHAPQDAGAVVGAMIAHPAVRRVNYTGSTRTGKIIAMKAAEHLKPALLELGGKAPLIVLDDADLDAAVDAAAFGAFIYQGQVCMSTEKVVVDQAVADPFVAKFAAKAMSLKAGNPRTGQYVVGTMIGRDAAERVHKLVHEAVGQGAKIVAGGRLEGSILSATVLDHVTPEMRIYHEETFGPIACVVRAKDIGDCVRIANDTEYGLSASVFGRDVNRALEVALSVDSGMCHVNGATVADEAQIPFGGTKASGYGRFGGKAVINEFTELRWITIAYRPEHYPF